MIVERFIAWAESAPGEQRAKAAKALSRAYLQGRFTDNERTEAEAALTLLVEDSAYPVRKALCEELAESPSAPRHIILALACDQPEIAMPVLAKSPIFIDGELVDLVATGSPAQQLAIACRANLSSAVSAAIAEVGGREAILALLLNESARITSQFLHRIAERHRGNSDVRHMLAAKENLAPRTRLLLIDRAGDDLRAKYEQSRVWLPRGRIDAMVRDQFDRAVISYSGSVDQAAMFEIARELIAMERLSTAFLLRTVCMGNLSLFAVSLSVLANVSLRRVEAILDMSPGSALRALLRQAGLPASVTPVFLDLLELWKNGTDPRTGNWSEDLPRIVTRKLLDKYGANASEGIDHLVVLLRNIADENEREGARSEVRRIIERARDRNRPSLAPPETAAATQETVEAAGGDCEKPDDAELSDDFIEGFAMHFAHEILELEYQLSKAARKQAVPAVRPDGEADATTRLAEIPSLDPQYPEDPNAAANDDEMEPVLAFAGGWPGRKIKGGSGRHAA